MAAKQNHPGNCKTRSHPRTHARTEYGKKRLAPVQPGRPWGRVGRKIYLKKEKAPGPSPKEMKIFSQTGRKYRGRVLVLYSVTRATLRFFSDSTLNPRQSGRDRTARFPQDSRLVTLNNPSAQRGPLFVLTSSSRGGKNENFASAKRTSGRPGRIRHAFRSQIISLSPTKGKLRL